MNTIYLEIIFNKLINDIDDAKLKMYMMNDDSF